MSTSSPLRKRLVVVTDSPAIVETIRVALRTSGEYDLVGRARGRGCSARLIVGARPEVVLLDDLDGSGRAIELTRAIKAEDERIAVIALSLEMKPAWLERIFDAGAIGAISKETPPDAFAVLIRETVCGRICLPVCAGHNPESEAARVVTEDLPLTARELETLRLAAGGSTNAEIARHLWITEQTVKFHLKNIYRKLDVENRTEASHFAHANGLVSYGVEPPVAPEQALRAAS